MLEKSLRETRCTSEVLAKDSFGGGKEPAPVCVCVCVSTSLGRCFCCIAGATLVATLQLLRHRWRSNLHSGSWVVHLCMLQTMMQHLSRHAVVYCILHLLPPTETRQKQGSAYPGASAIPGAPEVSSFAGPSAGSWDLYSI